MVFPPKKFSKNMYFWGIFSKGAHRIYVVFDDGFVMPTDPAVSDV
jgi:hypothetical protein